MKLEEVIAIWPAMVAENAGYPGQHAMAGTSADPLTSDRIVSLRVHTRPCPDGATGLVALAQTVEPQGWAYASATFDPNGAVECADPWYWSPTVDGVAAHVRLAWQRQALGMDA